MTPLIKSIEAPSHTLDTNESHHTHHHGHHADTCVVHNEALVSPRQAKIITRSQLGAAGMQLLGLLKGGLNPAAAIDMVHNVADAASWYGHSKLMEGRVDNKMRKKLTQYTYGAISFGGVLSIVEGARGVIAGGQEYASNAMNMTGSITSLAVASLTGALAYRGLRKKGYKSMVELARNKHDDMSKGVAVHALGDFTTASSAVMSTLPYAPTLFGSIAAMTAGAVSAAYFFPKKQEAKSWWQRRQYKGRHRAEKSPRLRKALITGVTTLAAGGALFVGADTKSSEQSPVVRAHSSPAIPAAPKVEHTPEAVLPGCVTVESGDSQWEIARSALRSVTVRPTERATMHVAYQVATMNMAERPNPHLIFPGDCLRMPSREMLITVAAE